MFIHKPRIFKILMNSIVMQDDSKIKYNDALLGTQFVKIKK
jgi:hypothetical protein